MANGSVMKRRTGTCNNCGQCCGTSGDSPYPKNWPEALWKWSLDDANEVCPQLTMFGIEAQGDEIGYTSPVGSYRVRGTLYYYVWVPGVGCCKDTSVAHDGSSWSAECPYLLDDPGDGSRPCALVGTNEDGARKKFCRHEEHAEYVPANDLWIEESVAQWEDDHDLCSYTWVDL